MLVFFAMSFLPRGMQAQESFGPPEVTVKSGPEQLTVEWDEVEGATGYKVQWRNSSTEADAEDTEWDASRQAMEPGTSTSNLIESLDPAITYDVRVFAKDMYGDYSDPSGDDDDTTDIPDLVTGTPAPGQVTGVAVTPGVGGDATNSLTVNWEGLDVATGYKVQWRNPDEVASWEDFEPIEDLDDATEDNQETVTAADSPMSTYQTPIPGLSAENTYTVRVIATNAADGDDPHEGGDGTPSEDATGRPRPGQVHGPDEDDDAESDDPLKVEALEGKLMVSWLEVEGADEYKVQWKSGTEQYDPSRQLMTDDGSETSLEIPDLIAGTVYTVRVFATNGDATDASDGGEGEPSVGAMETPLPGKVGTPTMTPGDRELTVNWNPVPGDGIGYKVQWKSEDQEYDDLTDAAADIRTATPTSSTPSPVTGTSYTITSLMAENTYTVRVIATSETDDLDGVGPGNLGGGGDGDPSDDATGNGRPKPGPIGTVTVDPEPGGATVSWPRVAGADEYIVQWKLATEVNYDRIRLAEIDQVPDGSTPEHRITGLGDINHKVQIYATNEGGDGTSAEEDIDPADPVGRVTGVKITPGVTTLTVEWDEVSEASGYTVQWKEMSETEYDLENDLVHNCINYRYNVYWGCATKSYPHFVDGRGSGDPGALGWIAYQRTAVCGARAHHSVGRRRPADRGDRATAEDAHGHREQVANALCPPRPGRPAGCAAPRSAEAV